jgi:hypothetical protein
LLLAAKQLPAKKRVAAVEPRSEVGLSDSCADAFTDHAGAGLL